MYNNRYILYTSTASLRFHAEQSKLISYARHRRRLYYGLLTRTLIITPTTDYNVLATCVL